MEAELPAASFQSNDVLEHEDALSVYDIRLRQLSADPFSGSIRFLRTDDAVVYLESWNADLQLDLAPPPGFILFTGALPGSRFNFCGQEVAGSRIAVLDGSAEASAATRGASSHWAVLARAQAVRGLAEDRGVDLGPATERGAIVADSSALPVAGACIARDIAHFFQRPEAMSDARVRRAIADRALGSVVGALAVPEAPGARAVGSPSPRSRVFSRALEVIHESRGPLRIPELARAVGTGQRTLEYAFRENLDRTPVQYLRAYRMNGVRRDLLRADPRESSVTEIALGWHFLHLGRFSVEYRKMFGESPSQTLRATYPMASRRLPGPFAAETRELARPMLRVERRESGRPRSPSLAQATTASRA